MKTNKNFNSFVLSVATISLLLFLGCSSDEIEETTDTAITSNSDTDDVAISLEGELQISDFVWQGLNQYYYWQEEVDALSDTQFNDQKAYAQYISENPDPDAFFETLKHPNDRFSWIQDDYVELENTLQGIYATNGVEFGLMYACQDCNELVGFVKYILKDSDADGKDIQRGDFFTGVNGTVLTFSNYSSLLFGDNLSYSLNMASVQNGALVENGTVVELTKEENFETDPIQVSKTLPLSGGEKVGYLMYNQFVADKSPNLNSVFADFKSEGITDLVIDLRYNGGGSVRNCVELASMITGQFEGEIFAQEQWNSKLLTYITDRFGEESLFNRFVGELSGGEQINSLNLNRVYVITTSESASASELLINGLASYIELIQVGEPTVGKNVGSITVYDYIDNDGTKNPDHTYAMQPIVLKIANSEGYADYADGLLPSTEMDEDVNNLGVLGVPEEPMLATVLNLISGTAKYSIPEATRSRALLIQDPLMLKRQQMVVDKKLGYQGKR
tara:strand:+ start:295 stop:1806 length:1512 start_codon:yes stop_codon:yes gene_type:complete